MCIKLVVWRIGKKYVNQMLIPGFCSVSLEIPSSEEEEVTSSCENQECLALKLKNR